MEGIDANTRWHQEEGQDFAVRYRNQDGWHWFEDLCNGRYTSVVDEATANSFYEKCSESNYLIVQKVKVSRYLSNGKLCVMSIMRHLVGES